MSSCIYKRLPGIALVVLFFIAGCSYSQDKMKENYLHMRMEMVRKQIEARGIRDKKVLGAMKRVERHHFVPNGYEHAAYGDYPLPIGDGQTISQPYIVALMTDQLDLDSWDKVLEVGTGSGYQAAILAEICDSVFSIEIFESLYKTSRTLLKDLGYDNVILKHGDGYEGWPEHAPFDAIIVTCAPTHIPSALEYQLSEGGRMIIPTGNKYSQELILLIKQEGKLIQKDVIPVRFVPMIGEDGKPY
ncbi:MAG: protein-L-isoaspartate(D-aspartate) O-methyltransferase [Bacteroidales bacterium]|nr:protein-L-isoaspartate(D-aspartate) O-methyltransferase [Bacteroidales bacterium]